jgi:glycosyltransferase involved in cell wall biosynthesis
MKGPVVIDLARLFIAPLSVTPRGIDRVDLGYARHFLEEWRGDCVATLPTPWGVRSYERRHALRLIAFVERLWRESVSPEQDVVYQRAKSWLRGAPSVQLVSRQQRPFHFGHIVDGFAQLVLHAGFSIGRSAVDSVPSNAIYLHTGHIGLGGRRFLRWLERRPDVKAVFMIHDAIPIENAEYVSSDARRFHEKMVASAARYAAGVIVTTQAAGESVRREILRNGRSDIAIGAVPLPVSPAFLGPTDLDPDLGQSPYFVVCGAIDPRKNHLLLLKVWRELVRQYGSAAPKLAIVGSRHRTHTAVVDMLERCDLIRKHVIELSGMSSPGLRRLLTGARALLMPSFAEGFGIPIIEALAVGTPVIASDLPSHREAGGNYVTYISPIDGLGWLSAIRAHATDDSRQARHKLQLRAYRPCTWPDYFAQIEPFIQSVPCLAEAQGVAADARGLQVLTSP